MISKFKKIIRYKNIRNKLLKEKKYLEKRIAKLEKIPDLGENSSPDVESDEYEELGNQVGVREILKERKEKVDEALERLKNGTYGKCLRCGKPISEELLRINPLAELCQKCIRDERSG